MGVFGIFQFMDGEGIRNRVDVASTCSIKIWEIPARVLEACSNHLIWQDTLGTYTTVLLSEHHNHLQQTIKRNEPQDTLSVKMPGKTSSKYEIPIYYWEDRHLTSPGPPITPAAPILPAATARGATERARAAAGFRNGPPRKTRPSSSV